MESPKLTIGMAHHNDYHGAYFTIQDIRKELIFNNRKDLLNQIQFVVVDNDPYSEHSKPLMRLLQNEIKPNNQHKYVPYTDSYGPASTKNKVFEEADGDFVLLMDSHVLLCPTLHAIEKLFELMESQPDTNDLYTGPLVYDDMKHISTHFDDRWRGEMWGTWGNAWRCACGEFNYAIVQEGDRAEIRSLKDQNIVTQCPKCGKNFPVVEYPQHEQHFWDLGDTRLGYGDETFEVPMNGCGLLFARRKSWLGFSPHFRGFGAEEGYIHEKYRQAGHHVYSLAYLKWLHRFGRPDGIKYQLTMTDKVWNYIVAFMELGKDVQDVYNHFVEPGKKISQEEWEQLHEAARNKVKPKRSQPKVVDHSDKPNVVCLCPTYKRPEALANAIKCFEKQNYPKERRRLFILDDSGQIRQQKGDKWAVASTDERFDNVWEKYNVMADHADDADIFMMWDDDDIYLPWHISAVATMFRTDQKQLFMPQFAFSTNPSTFGDVLKEKVDGRFHGGWAYTRKLWDAVDGFDEVNSHTGWQLMYEKCKDQADMAIPYNNNVVPTYVYRLLRGEHHLHDVNSISQYEEVWKYYGFIPTTHVDQITPELDAETAAIFKKFNV